MITTSALAFVLSTMLAAPVGPTAAASADASAASVDASAASPASPPPSTRRSTSSPTTITAPRLPPPPAAPPRRGKAKRLSDSERRSARGLIAMGGTLLGMSYLGGGFVAASQLDDVREDGVIEPHERDQVRISYLMLVPVIGPFASAPLASSRGDKAAFVGFGALQLLSASSLVIGGVMLARDQRARRWSLAAAPEVGGGTLRLRARF